MDWNLLELAATGIIVISWFQFFRITDAMISKRMVDAIRTVQLSDGQTVAFQYTLFGGHAQIDLIDALPIKSSKPETQGDASPLPSQFHANPLMDDKRNALLIIQESKRAENFAHSATDILGVRDIAGMGHETWSKAIDYMVRYHGIKKGKPGMLSRCGTDGIAPATLDVLQHSIRIHELPLPE